MDHLTDQEVRVAVLAALGLSNREIGDRIHLSVNTVKTHVASLFAKSATHNRSHLLALLMTDPGFRELVTASATDEGRADRSRWSESRIYEKLTEKELQVVVFGAHGHTHRETGELRFVSAETVKSRRTDVYERLDLHSMSDAVVRLMFDKRFRELFDEHVASCPSSPEVRASGG